MKPITRKDIGVCLLVATLGALVAQWFWLACEAFPPPTVSKDGKLLQVIFDDRPLVLTFNWYTTSKILLFIFSFLYTFLVAMLGRRLRRSPRSSELDIAVTSRDQQK